MQEKGRKALGAKGEEMDCHYLESRGHRILERNWRGGHLEVDIISQSSDGVHFVEVKTRTAPVAATVDDQVGAVKQHHIADAALKYLNTNHMESVPEVFFRHYFRRFRRSFGRCQILSAGMDSHIHLKPCARIITASLWPEARPFRRSI